MKSLILIVVGVCLAGGVIVYLAQRTPHPGPPTEPLKGSSVEAITESRDSETKPAAVTRPVPVQPATPAPTPAAAQPAAPASVNALAPSLPFQQSLGTLLSSRSSFGQKQQAWQQIKDSGHLDQLITELEKRSAADNAVADHPATLGQAYLQKAGTLNDIREQGILGMKADQSFDAALNLDPSNWEAGFWKATAMSYWPPQLGKGPEVIQRFVDLVKLQEAQQPQPQFVQTYLLLGEQYQKQGYPDYARQIWQRGVSLFPNDPKLVEKLSQPVPQAEQTAAR